MGENSRGKANLKRWVLSFERNVETDNKLRVSGGREFQSLGATTEKALLPRDVRTYGMDRTDESVSIGITFIFFIYTVMLNAEQSTDTYTYWIENYDVPKMVILTTLQFC